MADALNMIQNHFAISCPVSVRFSNFVLICPISLSALLVQSRHNRCLAWCRKLEHGGRRNCSLSQCNSSWAWLFEGYYWNSIRSSCSVSSANPLLNCIVHLTSSILFTSSFAVMTREQNHEYQQDYRNYLKYSGSSHWAGFQVDESQVVVLDTLRVISLRLLCLTHLKLVQSHESSTKKINWYLCLELWFSSDCPLPRWESG